MPESEKQAPKYPKRLWLAGPAPYVAQERILIPNSLKDIRFINGSTLVHDAEEEASVRKAIPENQLFEETPKFSKVHPRSGWLTTSQDAFNAHVDLLER